MILGPPESARSAGAEWATTRPGWSVLSTSTSPPRRPRDDARRPSAGCGGIGWFTGLDLKQVGRPPLGRGPAGRCWLIIEATGMRSSRGQITARAPKLHHSAD